jgi:phosphatidylinositol glycan class Z
LMDVNFYHAINSWTSVITPLNALLYNSNVTNLETHGLHPRYTHVLVNMSLLFGPMTLCFYKKLVDSMRRPALMKQSCITSQLCMGTVVSGLLLLSLAPHQEPRFLAPLLVPLSILTAEQVWKPRFRPLWIGFNLMLLTIYGVLHQGGVVPSLMSKAVTRDGPSSILYYRTYMPPSFLLRRECQTMVQECFMGSCVGSPPLIDLAGSSPYELRRILELNLKCEKEPPSFIYLVAPHVDDEVHMSSTKGCKIGYDYTCRSIWTVRPHLTTEDFPSFQTSFGDFLNSFELTIYNVSCKSAGDSE